MPCIEPDRSFIGYPRLSCGVLLIRPTDIFSNGQPAISHGMIEIEPVGNVGRFLQRHSRRNDVAIGISCSDIGVLLVVF